MLIELCKYAVLKNIYYIMCVLELVGELYRCGCNII